MRKFYYELLDLELDELLERKSIGGWLFKAWVMSAMVFVIMTMGIYPLCGMMVLGEAPIVGTIVILHGATGYWCWSAAEKSPEFDSNPTWFIKVDM